MVIEVSESDFQNRVVARSREVPVVVDFWASWCGPCRALSPALERAASTREGKVDLAKVDVDQNPQLSATYRVQGIPAVKAFRDGHVVDEFTGALPPAQVESFFDRLIPSDAELEIAAAISSGDEQALREASARNPRSTEVATALARILLRRGDDEAADELLAPFEHDFLAAGLRARAQLGSDSEAFARWDEGDHATALDLLQADLASTSDAARRDLIRRAMIGIFTELGPGDPLARDHRRRLAAALN